MLSWTTRIALELIGQGGLGHSFDTLEPDTPIPLYARTITELLYASSNHLSLIKTEFSVMIKPRVHETLRSASSHLAIYV